MSRMDRRGQMNRRCNCNASRNRNCHATARTEQIFRALLERARMYQAARAKRQPLLLTTNSPRYNPQSAPNSNPRPSPNANPTVALPLNLGTINVPRLAHRVDVRFNCASNRLPTGQVTHRLVVNVDVIYNPGTPGARDNSGAPSSSAPAPPPGKNEDTPDSK